MLTPKKIAHQFKLTVDDVDAIMAGVTTSYAYEHLSFDEQNDLGEQCETLREELRDQLAKPSLWTRAKRAAKRVGNKIVAAAKAVGRFAQRNWKKAVGAALLGVVALAAPVVTIVTCAIVALLVLGALVGAALVAFIMIEEAKKNGVDPSIWSFTRRASASNAAAN